MNRPRRPVRPSVQLALEAASEDWDCSSEDESDEEYGVEGSQDWSGASTRSSVKRVASVVAKFDEKKRELVREIGFGGILDLQQINKVSRTFTVWLLRNIDAQTRTIVVNGEPVVDMVDFDVKNILGIPCGSLRVTELDSDNVKSRKAFIQQCIGGLPTETNSLVAAARIVKKDYNGRMNKKQCDNFKVSFVVFVVGHLLAPTTRNNVGNSSFWGALTNPNEIQQYNWCEYVLGELVEAAIKVQSDIRQKKKISNITGCSILLQVIYFESVKIQGIERPANIYPRIKAYNCSYLRSLIEADQATSSSGVRRKRWGSSLTSSVSGTRLNDHFKAKSDGKKKAEEEMLDKLGEVGWFDQDLGEFAKDNLAGKLSESRVSALVAFGMRCDTHFDTLKKSLMKEALTLAEYLSCAPFVDPKKRGPKVDISRSYDGDNSASTRSKQSFEQIDEIVNKGYESATEGPMKKKKQSICPSQPYSQKEATSADTEHENVANKSTDNVSSQQVTIDPPSFDLGIEFQTQEKYMLGKKEVLKCDTVALNLSNNNSNIPEQGDEATGTVQFSVLCGTPASAKRKSDDTPFKGTPDQRMKPSATSPASKSKILAHAAVFAQITRSEDELDMNIKPWDHDTTESPVSKQSVEVCRLSKSPWFHGLKHRFVGTDLAGSIFDQIMSTCGDEENKSWIVHRNPRYLEVNGVDLKRGFTLQDPMSYDIYDLALRRIIQLDDSMYHNCSDKRWRHIFESDFATLSQADEKPCFHKTIREQFFGPSIDYKLYKCRMIVIPAQVLNTWCCYFWDFKKRMVHIMDPLYKVEEAEYFRKLHEPIADKVGADLANCVEMFFQNWSVQWNEWSKEYIIPVVKAGHRNESGFLSLLAIREFDGEGFRNMTMDSYNQFKMVLLAEMLSMEGNQANPLVKITPEKHATKVIHTID